MYTTLFFSVLLLLSPALMAKSQLLEITPNTSTCDLLKALNGNNSRLPAECSPCPEGQCKGWQQHAQQPEQHASLSNVNFDNNSVQLNALAEETLRNAARAMNLTPNESYHIQGHANRTGSYRFNLLLSQRRAENVRLFLIRMGVDKSRLIAEGFSYDRPYSDDPTDGINRRVEFVNSREVNP